MPGRLFVEIETKDFGRGVRRGIRRSDDISDVAKKSCQGVGGEEVSWCMRKHDGKLFWVTVTAALPASGGRRDSCSGEHFWVERERAMRKWRERE